MPSFDDIDDIDDIVCCYRQSHNPLIGLNYRFIQEKMAAPKIESLRFLKPRQAIEVNIDIQPFYII
jgi:hypothetical protein